jgi:hypothetical protein
MMFNVSVCSLYTHRAARADGRARAKPALSVAHFLYNTYFIVVHSLSDSHTDTSLTHILLYNTLRLADPLGGCIWTDSLDLKFAQPHHYETVSTPS